MPESGPAAADRRSEIVAEIRRRLDEIGDPCSVASGTPMGLDELGLIEAIELDDDGDAVIHLRLTSPTCMMAGYFDSEAKSRALTVRGVRSVEVQTDLGLDWVPEMIGEDAARRRRDLLRARGIPTT